MKVGEKVYVIFVSGTCDRKAIRFIMKRKRILAVDVQSWMIDAVEKRFGELSAPRVFQFLSDRGPVCRSTDMTKLATQLNLKTMFTIADSIESNRMPMAFVKTIRRACVYMNDGDDPKAVRKMPPAWYNDCNEIAANSALRMLSPIEYQPNQINSVDSNRVQSDYSARVPN